MGIPHKGRTIQPINKSAIAFDCLVKGYKDIWVFRMREGSM